MRLIHLAVSAALLGGCGSMSYQPVQEVDFAHMAADGCVKAGDRFTITAQISSAYEQTIVLFDGADASRTLPVRLPEPGVGDRARGIVGTTRYETSQAKLLQLRETHTPVAVTMTCVDRGKAPVADRFSFTEDGHRVDFEF